MLRACCRPRVGARIVSHVLPNSGSSAIAAFGLTRRTLAGLPTSGAADGFPLSADAAGGANTIGANELPWMKQFKETRILPQSLLLIKSAANVVLPLSPAP